MQEKRKSRRVNLIYHPAVYDAHSNKLFGNIVNISTGGFKVITKNQMKQGKEYLLRIDLPEETYGSKSVEVKASVRWCGKNTDPGVFHSGCNLVQILALGRLHLAALMTAYGS
jgi:hypothetical protein